MRKHLITAAILASCAAATSAYAVDIGENTTVGGQAFFDFTNISDHQGQTNGTDPAVAPSGTGFDATNANPCAKAGNGAIPDASAAQKAKLQMALTQANAGLAATDLAAAQKDAADAGASIDGAK